jgi:cobalt/nickel transport system ATP-binding protein
MNSLIELENLYFKYETVDTLSDINLKIEKGDSLAVIGSNGSGKSTLLKVLCGIRFAYRGSYVFDGVAVNEKKMKDDMFFKTFHKRVGFVFQNTDAQIFCPTVYDEVAFGPLQMGFDDDEIRQRVGDCLGLLGIGCLESANPLHLSEGEKKKVAIASVLSSNPDVLVLDEPMNNLDPRTKNFLKDLLVKLNSSGKTVICVTHEFRYIDGVFKRAVVLSERHGLIADGRYESVVSDVELLKANNII